MSRSDVTSAWHCYWHQRRDVPVVMEPLSKEAFECLSSLVHLHCGIRCLEAGSGIISAELARCGADVVLIDLVWVAAAVARGTLRDRQAPGKVITGDLFALPFQDDVFDVVWNAGAVEHFRWRDQTGALREMARVSCRGGLVASFNPNQNATVYRTGKWWSQRSGRWPYGPEYPIANLAHQGRAAGLRPLRELSICPFAQLLCADYLPHPISQVIQRLAARVPTARSCRTGYPVTSVFQRD